MKEIGENKIRRSVVSCHEQDKCLLNVTCLPHENVGKRNKEWFTLTWFVL